MHIGIVSPWENNGGLSEYTSCLVNGFKSHPNVEVSVIPWDRTGSLVDKSLINPLQVIRQVRQLDIDIFHVQFVMGDYLPSFLPIVNLVSKHTDIEIVVTFHEHYNYKFVPFRRTLQEYRNQISRLIDRIIVHTDTEMSWLPPRAREKSSVIPHGAESRPNEAEEEKRIFLPGYISDKKDCETAIHAMNSVSEIFPEYTLLIAGQFEDDKYYDELEKTVTQTDTSKNVNILDEYIPKERYQDLFKSSAVILIPQVHSASSSGTLSDVLAYKKPAVITNAPALKEYTKYRAKYYTFGSEEGLSERIKELLSDPAEREMMRQEFMKLADEYSWEHTAKQHISVYEQLV